MRRVILTATLVSSLVAFVPAFAAEPAKGEAPTEAAPAPSAGKPAADDPNRMVCTREHVVGSNRPQKVCMTVAQRQRLKDQAERTLDPTRRRPSGDNAPVGPS